MTTCPCCGFRFEGDLRNGCAGCGARAVGAPLPKPEHELPAYGRPVLLVAAGILMVLGFLVETIVALAQRLPFSFDFWSLIAVTTDFWSWLAAAETAAWRLKWISIPVTFVVLWGGRRVYGSILKTPSRFVGLRVARNALLASALVSLLIATLIAVTIPARLEQRRLGIEAGLNAQAHRIDRALLEYQALYGALPTELKALTDKKTPVPDPDGSLAAALANTDPSGYKATADVAVKTERRTLPGAVIRNASVSSVVDDPPAGGLSFTNYELRLPGEDKLLNTDDDLILRDGVIMKASEVKEATPPAKAPVRQTKR